MPSSVATLRALIDRRFPDAAPIIRSTTEPVATGILPLDRVLPGGGLPRGKLAVWAPLGGASAILRAACRSALAGGERAVWVDGAGTASGAAWEDGLALLRPKSRTHALRAAEELLRSGGFALVVLAGAEAEGTEAVRLTRAAREGGAALVALTERTALSSLRLTSRLLPHGYRWRRDPFGAPAEAQLAVVRVHARALGWNAHADFPLPVLPHELRLSLEPGLADRRGLRR
jgi:hypothetical protein